MTLHRTITTWVLLILEPNVADIFDMSRCVDWFAVAVEIEEEKVIEPDEETLL